MLKFKTKFPYLYHYGKNSLNIHRKDIRLPGSKRIMGYLLKFKLNLTEMTTHFTSISKHSIFVYYEHPEMYTSDAFPHIVRPMKPW